MSPEQCQSKTLDARSDIYSLGATYYSLLAGVTPHHEIESTVQVMFAHVHGEPLEPRKINAAVPEACARIVSRATAKSLGDRYQTAAEMYADLAAAHLALGGNPLGLHHSAVRSETAAPAASRSGQSGARRWMPLAAILSAAVVLLGV